MLTEFSFLYALKFLMVLNKFLFTFVKVFSWPLNFISACLIINLLCNGDYIIQEVKLKKMHQIKVCLGNNSCSVNKNNK